MNTKSYLFFTLAFVFLLTSCNKDENALTLPAAASTGKLTGKVMSKNAQKPIGDALVFILNDQGKVFYTRTDASGNFLLEAPAGSCDLQIQTGGGSNFRTTLPVNITKDQTAAIDPTATRLEQVAKIAYVAGSYDNIEDIVTGLGYSIDMITNADLLDYNIVSQYDIIFLNCGAKHGSNSQNIMDANLANFVTNGGSLYASDWAVAYLTGGDTRSTACNMPNGFIPDDKLCTASTGSSTTIAGAQITDGGLAASIGFSNLDITYDLGMWEQINSLDAAFWDVMVNDPNTNSPLMIRTNHFSGGTLLTQVGQNAADQDWITICHHESESDPITITIPAADWSAHEAHGDSLGGCSNTNNSGTIFFTTFHNHAGGNTANMGLILQYIILNL